MSKYLSKIFFVALGVLFLGNVSIAQNSKAVEYINKEDYNKAVNILTVDKELSDLNVKDLSLLGVCYVALNDYSLAENVYKEITERDKISDDFFIYYAEVLLINDKYDKAKGFFKKYLKENPESKVVKLKVESCDLLKKWDKETPLVSVENLKKYNTKFDEKSLSSLKDNLVFVSNSIPEEFRTDTNLANNTSTGYLVLSERKKYVNKNLYDDYSCEAFDYSKNTSTVAYTLRKKKKYVQETAYSNAGIYFQNLNSANDTLKEFKWEEMPEKINLAHPAFANKGKRLFFVSDMSGGKGESDIYYSDYENGKWKSPVNIGGEINSEFNEVFPQISGDTLLYFSSDGHPGYGNLDIYKVKINGDNFGEPENLKAPINSIGNDFSFYHKDKYTGYFTSNRSESSIGMNDIYKFTYPEPVIEEPEEEEPEEEPYVHVFRPADFNPLPVYFDLDSDKLDDVFHKELSRIADTLKAYDEYNLVITGFSDSKGPKNYSIELADKRAENVKDFITGKGVKASRIQTENGGIAKDRNTRGINYHIQIGSSKSEDAIKWYNDKLDNKYDVKNYLRGDYYVYYAGRFSSKDKARKAKNQIKDASGIEGMTICSSKGKMLTNCFYALNRRVVLEWIK